MLLASTHSRVFKSFFHAYLCGWRERDRASGHWPNLPIAQVTAGRDETDTWA